MPQPSAGQTARIFSTPGQSDTNSHTPIAPDRVRAGSADGIIGVTDSPYTLHDRRIVPYIPESAFADVSCWLRKSSAGIHAGVGTDTHHRFTDVADSLLAVHRLAYRLSQPSNFVIGHLKRQGNTRPIGLDNTLSSCRNGIPRSYARRYMSSI